MISTPWPYGAALPWAKQRHWSVLVQAGVVGIRAFHYLIDSDQSAPHGGEIPDLIVRARAQDPQPLINGQLQQNYQEIARWHPASGIYGFLTLQAEEVIIEVLDPKGRYLPEVIRVDAPDRKAIKAALQRGEAPTNDEPRPACIDVLLRPSALMAPRPGSTRLWGVVSQAGREVPAAVLQIETVYKAKPATVTTMSMADGSYMLELPGELAEQRSDPTDREMGRKLHVFVPEPQVVQQLRDNFLAALPVDLFKAKKYAEMQEANVKVVQSLDQAGRGPRSPTGDGGRSRMGRREHGEEQDVVIQPGRQQRCDIQLIT